MEYSSIKELINMIDKSTLTHFELEFDGAVLKMKKGGDNTGFSAPSNEAIHKAVEAVKVVAPISSSVETTKEAPEEKISGGNLVKSPIVGTFYGTSSPGKPAFVKVGDTVKQGDVLCIVEAMKVMNEITSEFDGEILEIFLKDEDMVEYGQPLFRIK